MDDETCPKAADVIFHLLLPFLPPLSIVQGNDSLFSTRFQNTSPPVMPRANSTRLGDGGRPFPGSGCYINSVTGLKGDLICLSIFGFRGNIKQACDKNVGHSYEN